MKLLFAFIVVLLTTTVFGGEERYTNRIEGSSISIGSTLDLFDDKYLEMASNSSWPSLFTNYKVNNKVTLGLNKEVVQMNTFSGSVSLKITYETWNGTSFITQTTNQTLTVSNNLNPLATIDDLSSYVFTDAHHVKVEVLTLSSGLTVGDLFLESEIQVERYYTFDGSVVTGAKYITTGVNNDYIEFSWNNKNGAELYELEWVHINDYTIYNNAFISSTELTYNYYLNSTRVSLSANYYKIPKILDHGYLLFRVRAIGKQGTNFSSRKEGLWNAPENGTISIHPVSQTMTITNEYDPGMNWHHQIGYTEEGKRKEMISFTDGLGKERQNVSHNTATEQAVVSNLYYDELGRPVIKDLPTPVNGEQLKHYLDFNRANVTGEPSFNKTYFDEAISDPCVPLSQGFSTNYGAGQYYSPNNPNKLDENANVPDAERYPFSRVTYLDDFTGRISKTSGFGKDLKIGSGHETEYIYPSINQVELSKLFGTEAGYKDHYQKMVTIDPNGQMYVQYTNMSGKVVASYMAGDAPSNVDPLTGNGGQTTTVSLIANGMGQNINMTPPSSSLTYDEYIYSNGNYKFSYGFSPEQYATNCMNNICFDCVYDLELKVTDDCGQVVWQETKIINGESIDAICNGATTYTYQDAASNAYKELTLEKGKYNIFKKLSVNQSQIDDYWCYYVENNTCITPISTTFNREYQTEEFINCTPEIIDIEVEPGDCDGYKEVMLMDMKPGGQYARYNANFTCNDPTSIFYTGTNPFPTHNWQSIGHYYDENGVEIFVSINGAAPVSPATLTMQQFITNFDDSWAISLLAEHPEKCYLDFCYLNSGQMSAYEAAMMAEYTYTGAESFGFFRPVIDLNPSVFGSSEALDPFFNTGGFGANYSANMKNNIEHYYDYPVSGNTTMPLTMMEYAILMSADCAYLNNGTPPTSEQVLKCIESTLAGLCTKDLIWVNFRKLYLEQKQLYVYQAQQAYAVANGCSNACIGAETPCSAPFDLLANKASRFGNISQFGNAGTNPTDFQNGVTAQVTAGCTSSCEQYANDWLTQLSGCDFVLHNVNQVNLKADLIALCMSGCDQDHPTGSSTSPTGTSIDDVLAQYGLTTSNLCTELLISEPEPYRPVSAMITSVQSPLDNCACDEIQQAANDYIINRNNGTLPQGVTNKEQMLAYNTGASIEDIDHLICMCKIMARWDQPDGIEAGWVMTASGNRINNKYPIPNELACETGSRECLTCDIVQTDITNLLVQFPQYSTLEAFQQADNYEVILTNYINNTHFFTLNYSDYASFIAGCNATSTNPYCIINPLATEWKEVMKLITFQGKLITNQNNPLQLVVSNIVYKHGKLQTIFAGNDYWSTVNGNNLELYFGTQANNCAITLTKDAALNFEDIVSFGTISPMASNCGGNNAFEIEVEYIDCGIIKTGVLQGTSTCFSINECICGDNGQLLCNELPEPNQIICYQPRLDEIYQNAITAYEESITKLYQTFKWEYNNVCAGAFFTENFSYIGNINTYQYTLYYYDQAGNLVKTIAPEGIDIAYQSSPAVSDVEANMAAKIPNVPSHTYKTTYAYNSYNQLVTTSNPDQDGNTNYWYDRYGRIVASQNPIQAAENKYSYTLYDKRNRIIEVGQVANTTTVLREQIVKANDVVPGTTFNNWITTGTRTEITKTHYDKSLSAAIPPKFSNGQQQNLRSRVASILYYENQADLTYTSAIHYSYDVHGNVIEQLQDVPMMAVVAQDVKSTQYEFELISKNVSKIDYQKGKADYITHTYEYDAENRLTKVYTSTNDVHQTREAHYRYYDYGPMVRTELGEYQVQGNDYAYTINGWIKGVNASTLEVTRDMGKDGSPSTGSGSSASTGYLPNNADVHSEFARDVFGYTLGYFSGDYKAIGNSTMEANYLGTTFDQASQNLFNGNIRHIVTAIDGFPVIGTAYQYDQLNRIKQMQAYYNGTFSTNNWQNGSATNDYYNSYEYDKNGNITHLKRNSTAAIGLLMDDFTYNYTGLDGLPNASSNRKSNRLNYVNDQGQNDAANSGDIKAGMLTGNYTYNAIGELTADATEGISSIEWRRGDHKVKRIARSNANSSEVSFMYNPLGVRILKIEKPRINSAIQPESTWKYTYYAHEANGQEMAVYSATISSTDNKADLEERPVYGSSRLGMLREQVALFDNGVISDGNTAVHQNTLGNRHYEITNHLSNVNAVISDRKMVSNPGVASLYEAVVIMKSDYYPFGQEMPGRHVSTSDYRFGYNGMEKDDEVKGEGNSYTTEFRQYDSRLGRWLSIDPIVKPWESGYAAFSNNPVYYTDPSGLDPGDGLKAAWKAIKTGWNKISGRNCYVDQKMANSGKAPLNSKYKDNLGRVFVNTENGWIETEKSSLKTKIGKAMTVTSIVLTVASSGGISEILKSVGEKMDRALYGTTYRSSLDGNGSKIEGGGHELYTESGGSGLGPGIKSTKGSWVDLMDGSYVPGGFGFPNSVNNANKTIGENLYEASQVIKTSVDIGQSITTLTSKDTKVAPQKIVMEVVAPKTRIYYGKDNSGYYTKKITDGKTEYFMHSIYGIQQLKNDPGVEWIEK